MFGALKLVLLSGAPALARLLLASSSSSSPSLALPSPPLSASSVFLSAQSLPSTSVSGPVASPLPSPSNGQYLDLTALVTTSQNVTALECWRLTDPFVTSASTGTMGVPELNIESLANMTFTVLPPRFDGGIHNAPHPQYVAVHTMIDNESLTQEDSRLVLFTSGLAHITLLNGTDDAWILGGKDGVIIAVDTTGTGHETTYPSDQETICLQIPFTDGIVPAHAVLHSGACNSTSQIVVLS